MAQQQRQEGGWPLGLQPLNVRAGGAGRSHDYSGSISFNTLLSGSPSSSSDSSSDLDTESTGSFFHDRSITLGNLMGVSSIMDLSRRSLRGRRAISETITLGNQKRPDPKSRPWCFNFCLCPRNNIDLEIARNNTVPLGHFLEVERKAAHEHRRAGQHSPLIYGPDEIGLAQPLGELSNSLFVNGQIAPPMRSSPWSTGSDTNGRKESSRGLRTPCF